MHLMRVKVDPHIFDLPVVESMIEIMPLLGDSLSHQGEDPPLDFDKIKLADGQLLGDVIRDAWGAAGIQGYAHRSKFIERFLAGWALHLHRSPWQNQIREDESEG